MCTVRYLGVVLCLLCAGAVVAAQPKSDDGFVSLYNGKDLAGWKTTGNWFAEDEGVLAIEPRPGEKGWKRFDAYLWSQKQYGDFIFDVEYKIICC